MKNKIVNYYPNTLENGSLQQWDGESWVNIPIGNPEEVLVCKGPGILAEWGPTPDSDGPTIDITSPTTNPSYNNGNSNTITISGTSTDPSGVTSVTYSMSGDTTGSGNCSGTTSWSTSTLTLNSGTTTITIYSQDSLGNINSETITVTCDLVPPAVQITSPTTSSSYNNGSSGSITISGVASDDVGISSVTYSMSGATSGSGTCSGTSSWSTGSLSLNTGTTTITITAIDTSGNSVNDSISVSCDLINPTVTITSPTSGSGYTTTSSSITLAGNASDSGGSGLSSVTYSMSGATSGSGTCSGTSSWSTGSRGINVGTTNFTIIAHDNVGRTGTDTLQVTRQAFPTSGLIIHFDFGNEAYQDPNYPSADKHYDQSGSGLGFYAQGHWTYLHSNQSGNVLGRDYITQNSTEWFSLTGGPGSGYSTTSFTMFFMYRFNPTFTDPSYIVCFFAGSIDFSGFNRSFISGYNLDDSGWYTDTTNGVGMASCASYNTPYLNSESGKNNVLNNNNWNIVTLWGNGSTNAIYINGIQQSLNYNEMGSYGWKFFMGSLFRAYSTAGGNTYGPDCCEFMAYDRALSSSEITTVTNYIQGKWGI